MKHLKLFENFKNTNNADIISDIKDILLPISDLGYYIKIRGYFVPSIEVGTYRLEITITKKGFSMKEIVDDTSRLVDYMKNYQSIYRASPKTYVSFIQKFSQTLYMPIGFSILSNAQDKQITRLISSIKILYDPKTPNSDIFTEEDEIEINL